MTSVREWLEKWLDQQLAAEPRRMPKTELLELLKNSPKSVVVVDLRNEQEKGVITQAVHVPATTINGPRDIEKKLVDQVLLDFPEARKVVIHCNSSGKRSSFVGGWAKDHFARKSDELWPKTVDVEILHEGIVGWLNGSEEFQSETTLIE